MRRAACRSCSIWGTAFCRRRRHPMSRIWSRKSGAPGETGRRPLQSGRARQSGSRRTFPAGIFFPIPPSSRCRLCFENRWRASLQRVVRRSRAKSMQRLAGDHRSWRRRKRRPARSKQALARQGTEARAFVAMRCWKPFSDEAARAVASWKPDKTILLPLYPQFSTTTTGSSFEDWNEAAARAGLATAHARICCYPEEPGFIAAEAALIAASSGEENSPP